MPQVVVVNANGDDSATTFDAREGRRLVLEIEDAGIDILHRCGGKAKCTTCRCVIIDGDPGQMRQPERDRLAREDDLQENVRLACQIEVENDLSVHVINRLHLTDLSDAGPRPTEEMEP